MNSGWVVVMMTAPNLKVARQLAASALTARQAACANILPKLESHYWWQGKITSGREVVLLFKTTRARVKLLEAALVKAHPYDTPEFLALNVALGSKRYLDWVTDSVRPPARRKSRD
jgi:periplasmic divalent cation tolerance protein